MALENSTLVTAFIGVISGVGSALTGVKFAFNQVTSRLNAQSQITQKLQETVADKVDLGWCGREHEHVKESLKGIHARIGSVEETVTTRCGTLESAIRELTGTIERRNKPRAKN